MKKTAGRIIVFLIPILISSFSFAQDLSFARKIVDSLASPYYAGRGYVDDGDLKASRLIAGYFKKFGLQAFPGAMDYMQPFSFPVNTFPGKMEVKIDDVSLIPGKDYITDPVSGGCKKEKLKIIFIDSVRMNSILNGNPGMFPHKKFAIALDKKLLETTLKNKGFDKISALKPSALISINDGRLIWSVSSVHIDIPFIEIRKEAINMASTYIYLQIDEKQIDHNTQNVTGFIKGRLYPDSFIFITAHYDHLGEMGEGVYFPGANDNASGTALLLDLVHYYASLSVKPSYSIGFISFAGEEAGLLGSKYYTNYPIVPLSHISFLINMDLMANGQDGMMVVNGSVFPAEFSRLIQINDSAKYLKVINKRGKAANSDHYWFTEKGVSAFFFYLLGEYPYYHDVFDTADKPTYAGYNGAFRLIRDFINTYGSYR